MKEYPVFEALFIILALSLIVAVIKYPKDAFIKLPLAILKKIFWPLLAILYLASQIIGLPLLYFANKFNWKIAPWLEKLMEVGASKDDRPLPSTRTLDVNFKNGKKYIIVISPRLDLKAIIADFVETLTDSHSTDSFRIAKDNDYTIISCPDNTNFYDFHILTQHLNNELGDQKSFGLYKSSEIQYFVFQDRNTANNLVGFTSDNIYFSIHMLDDLNNKEQLRVNQKLKLNKSWIDKWVKESRVIKN